MSVFSLVGARPQAAATCVAGKFSIGHNDDGKSIKDYLNFFKSCKSMAPKAQEDLNPVYIEYNDTIDNGTKRSIDYAKRLKLGEGSYGEVHMYVADDVWHDHIMQSESIPTDVPSNFAVKYIKRTEEVDTEVKALSILNNEHHTLAAEARLANTSCFLMPVCDGDLDKLAGSKPLTLDATLNILHACLELLANLWKHGVSYMDIKAGNMLYVACDKHMASNSESAVDIRILLGDLGSVHPIIKEGVDICYGVTFPFPASCRSDGSTLVSAKGMLWAVAVMGIQLMGSQWFPTDKAVWRHDITCAHYHYRSVKKELGMNVIKDTYSPQNKERVYNKLCIQMFKDIDFICKDENMSPDATKHVRGAFHALTYVGDGTSVHQFDNALKLLKLAELKCENDNFNLK